MDQQIGEYLTGKHRTLTILDRPRAGRQSRLVREGREQPLREGMDRIDAQAPAGAI